MPSAPSSTEKDRELIATSKFLSLILRHQPQRIGLTLNDQGWASIEQLTTLAAKHDKTLNRELIEQVVAEDGKQRFALSADGRYIRANQGHSIAVDLGLRATEPPALLYHGTATRFVDAILREGLRKGSRQHVHLSAEPSTAARVGQRHGKPQVLTVLAQAMLRAGHVFYLSDNGVWLTDAVPTKFLRTIDDV